MEYNEDDFLMLSGIQHFAFCRRQWALIHIEQQWYENVRTIEGELLHKKAHDNYIAEKRKDLVISRGMPVFSRSMGVSGICDIVEFCKGPEGIPIFGREGAYSVYPVEYKRGVPKSNEIDILQLAAQAMCLEEMLSCEINEGAIFYGEIRRREKVQIDIALKEQVKTYFIEMHKMYEKRYTPKAKLTKACNACSLKDICIPRLEKTCSAHSYILQHITENGE